MESAKSFTRSVRAMAILASSAAFAIEVQTGNDDLKLDIRVLLQVRAVGSWDGDKPTATGGAAPNGTFGTDFYLRRARLLVTGSAYERLVFFLLVDSPNYGIRGDYSGSTFVQDLHISYLIAKDFELDVGFLLMPVACRDWRGCGFPREQQHDHLLQQHPRQA